MAFDKVNHEKLFLQTLTNLRLIQNWYSNQEVFVRFGIVNPCSWFLKNGVRQRKILNPLFFAIYILKKILNIECWM